MKKNLKDKNEAKFKNWAPAQKSPLCISPEAYLSSV